MTIYRNIRTTSGSATTSSAASASAATTDIADQPAAPVTSSPRDH